MKRSKFIVSQKGKLPGTILIYSTFSTSLVELEEIIYKTIFENADFESYPSEVDALYKMGFLIDDDYDELRYLESLRNMTLNANRSTPTYYIVCPTTGCNARCYYCFEKGVQQRKMSKETAEAVADYIIANHDEEHLVIQWFGGEPLLEPGIISLIVDKLHRNKVNFDSKIITNGSLLTDEIVRCAKNEWNVKIIQITIDALFEDYNRIKDYYKLERDPFELVMENIQRCLDCGINIRIRINFNPLENEKAITTVNYLKERFGSDKNFFVYLAPIDSKEIPSITEKFDDEKQHPLIQLLDAERDYCSFGNYDSRTETGTVYDAILKKYYLTPIPTSCYGGCQSSLTIDSAGYIFDCHRLLGHEEYASGDVFNGRVNGEITKIFTDSELSNDECASCSLLPLCQGGCKYRAMTYGKEHACTFVKGVVEELIMRAADEINEL